MMTSIEINKKYEEGTMIATTNWINKAKIPNGALYKL